MYLHTDCQKNPTYLETTVYGTQKNDALDTGSWIRYLERVSIEKTMADMESNYPETLFGEWMKQHVAAESIHGNMDTKKH